MGINYLWDTNTAIYYLQQQFPKHAENFIDNSLIESIPAISSITEIELLCWKNATSRDMAIMKSFIADSFVFGLEPDIKNKTVDLKRTYSIKLPDAIIAATAIVNDFTLLSRNAKDFDKISGLKWVNPFDVK